MKSWGISYVEGRSSAADCVTDLTDGMDVEEERIRLFDYANANIISDAVTEGRRRTSIGHNPTLLACNQRRKVIQSIFNLESS